MAGLSKEELDERCIKRFGEKDQTLIPVYAIGAEFGYFGRVDDREISNASGMYGDPLFIHKMMEKGVIKNTVAKNKTMKKSKIFLFLERNKTTIEPINAIRLAIPI